MSVSYSGSYLGSHRTGVNGEDMTYTYPPDFVMTFPRYRKQSSWDRDAILNKALMEYVNRPENAAPKVDWTSGKATLVNIDIRDIPTGVEGGKLTVKAQEKVGALVPVAGKEKLGGFVLLIGALVVFWYFLFCNIRRG
jgi:hypothetical protein